MPEEVGDITTGTNVSANDEHVSERRHGSKIRSRYESVAARYMFSIRGFASFLAKHSSKLKMAGFRTAGCSFPLVSVNISVIIHEEFSKGNTIQACCVV